MVKGLKDEPILLESKLPELSSTLATIAPPFTTNALNGSSTTFASAFLQEINDLACGSLAGMIGKVIEHPFDTVKVRLQTQNQFAGPINCLNATLRHEGVIGLFRGLSAPMLGSMIENATLFFTYRHCQNFIQTFSVASSGLEKEDKEPLTFPQLAAAGALAGAIVSFVLTPFELVKCRAQVAGLTLAHPTLAAAGSLRPNISPLSIITYTLRTEGICAFYRGHIGTLLRECGGGAVYFGIYEAICRKFCNRRQKQLDETINTQGSLKLVTKDDLAAWELMMAGAFAGIGFNLSLFPADVIKSRIQTSSVKVGFLKMAKQIYMTLGPRGFYRGCGITLMRSVPSNACIFYTYETLSRWSKKVLL